MSATVDKPQHMQALELARTTYTAQRRALREVKAGGSISDVLFSDDPRLGSIPIGKLIGAQRRWGEGRTNRLLRRLVIHQHRPIRKLTDRQKREIVTAVSGGREREPLPDTTAPTHKNGAAPRLTRPAPRPKEKPL